MVSLVGNVLINKKLPGKDRILNAGKKFLGDLTHKPVQTIKRGIAKDRAAVQLMKAGTGMSRMQAVRNVAPALAEGVYKAGGKDLVVNTGGLGGSIIGGALGAPGALAGDLLGARVVRRALDDGEALRSALKINNNKKFQQLSPLRKANIIRRRAQGYAKGHNTKELLPDTIGWGIGNGAASGLDAMGVGIPLKGAAVAMATAGDTVKGVTAGHRFTRRFGNPVAGVSATVASTGRKLRRRYSLRRHLRNEQQAYNTVNETLNRRLPQLPQGLDFSAQSTSYFLADFSQKQSDKHLYSVV